jgi:hypothetical protein
MAIWDAGLNVTACTFPRERPTYPVEPLPFLATHLFYAYALSSPPPPPHPPFQPCLWRIQAKLGSTLTNMTTEALNTTVVGYTGALESCLQLLGPAVLYAYKHGADGDKDLPPGGGGCPLSDDGSPLEGALVRDAAVNLFGCVTARLATTEGTQSLAGVGSCSPRVLPAAVTVTGALASSVPCLHGVSCADT